MCSLSCHTTTTQDAIATAHSTADFYTKRKPLSATINTLANALYKVFCYTGDKAHEEMRQASGSIKSLFLQLIDFCIPACGACPAMRSTRRCGRRVGHLHRRMWRMPLNAQSWAMRQVVLAALLTGRCIKHRAFRGA